MSIQQDPAYHQGFYDAMEGEPLFDDCPSEAYRVGWTAFWECRSILASILSSANRNTEAS